MARRRTAFALTRCAIYTRQSVVSREADPALTSCQIQRDACVAFIRTRTWQGWYPVEERFDDEGWSGAKTDRRALDFSGALRQIHLAAGS